MESKLTMKELVPLVVEWGREKGILEKSTPLKQLCKTIEESTELVLAILNDDRDAIIDAVGDVLVTLILYCEMRGVRYTDIIVDYENNAHTLIVDNLDKETILVGSLMGASLLASFEKGYITDGRFSFKETVLDFTKILHTYCEFSDLPSLEECLQSAYNVISKRTGKMVDGLFVKDN